MKETKKRSMRDLTNFEFLGLLERANIRYSVKISDIDANLYTIFVRKEDIKNENQVIVINRLHFGKGKEAYVKVLKKGITPYEFLVESSEEYKKEHPEYVSRKSISNFKREDIEISDSSSSEEPEEQIEDSEDIPF